jgi:RHH-type proline utilization regulon transcriptional repressor/proline dehydrogenase/delta 1-pyrroline-5-carboxylate dehydrogenase
VQAGNIYVNRNLIGAVVGVQPFGGHGLSGTGPKAGGPLYLRRLLALRPAETGLPPAASPSATLESWRSWLAERGEATAAARCAEYARDSRLGLRLELPGPVGETNLYRLEPKGSLLCLPSSSFGAYAQIAAALATGNQARIWAEPPLRGLLATLPPALAEKVVLLPGLDSNGADAVLFEGDSDALRDLSVQLARRQEGAILPIFGASPTGLATGMEDYPLDLLLSERSVSTNTAAAGGNASLMSIG